MINKKNTGLSAFAGAVFSFLVSIVSTGRVTVSLLRALIAAAVFAVLYIVLDALAKKFLASGGEAEQPAASRAKRNAGQGGVVNITVGDGDFGEDAEMPRERRTEPEVTIFSYGLYDGMSGR